MRITWLTGSNTANLIVLAIYTDGTSEDVTSKAEIIPQQNGIVNISNGIIKGISYNPVAISVTYQGKTDTVNMLIKDLKSEVTAKTISLDKYTIDLLSGSTANIIVTVEYCDVHTENVTTKATYTNPNSSIASISAGKITAKSKGTTIITVSFKGSLGDTVTAQLTINVLNRDPYNRNEAEEYNAQNGIQTENCSDTGGGINVGYIKNGDWLRFNSLDFGSGAASFEARIASATNGGNIEICLDSPTGTLAGSCVVPGTGGWQTWVTKSYSVSGLSGIHDIYLKFIEGSSSLFNINWWKFKPEQTELVHEENSSSNEIPKSFSLGQNYPNPFNPRTVINYQLAANSKVTLKVYSIIGKEVATLVNEEKPAGEYKVVFDASALSSEIYFYTLHASNPESGTDFLQAKKFILLK